MIVSNSDGQAQNLEQEMQILRHLLDDFRAAQYNFDLATLRPVSKSLFADDALIQFCHPFGTLAGSEALIDKVYEPLLWAVPDLERRDTIVMAGTAADNSQWVGCCGYYTGLFTHAWLDIPPTHQHVSLRYHEFFRIENGKVVEVQAIWDIPELMMQAGVWPMVPSLGREWHVPGPATQDGVLRMDFDQLQSLQSFELVEQMCNSLGEYAESGVEGMRLDKYWHPQASWYGPSGIGTARGIEGFRQRHQIPFLNGLPDRVGDPSKGYLFADNNYVGFTAWPGMHMTISGDGWLGIAPAGQQITMRSLDFWRCENGVIRENWVLIDLLDVYRQINVDVFARMKELYSLSK